MGVIRRDRAEILPDSGAVTECINIYRSQYAYVELNGARDSFTRLLLGDDAEWRSIFTAFANVSWSDGAAASRAAIAVSSFARVLRSLGVSSLGVAMGAVVKSSWPWR